MCKDNFYKFAKVLIIKNKMHTLKSIERKVNKLPPDLIAELNEYIDFLLAKSKKRKGRKLNQKWAGALSDYSNEFTSVELQKKVLDTIKVI